MTYDLSILIPARNEMWISNTVDDILRNKRGKTEVIVGLDGAWADPGIAAHPDVRIIYMSESIGQRAMTNRLAQISTAKYVAKCDAHVAFSEGFDTALMDDMQDNYTMVPILRNLHVFDWKCMKCGSRWYMGPQPLRCMKNSGTSGVVPNEACDETVDFQRKLVWKPNPNRPENTSYRFNTELRFTYWSGYKAIQEATGDHLVETLSLQGSFFMMTREKYWELGICDETWGSWGQQGTEVALKTWLSGGRVVCNKNAWYAHMFRTQPGFSWPYPMPGSMQERARSISQDIFLKNKWPQQIHPLSWLLEKFWPIPDWNDNDLAALKEVPLDGKVEASAKAGKIIRADKPTTTVPPGAVASSTDSLIAKQDKGGLSVSRGIIYYTDNRLPTRLAHKVQDQIKSIGLPIASASLKPMSNMGTNVVVQGERGYLTMFKQILAALEASTADIVYFCEHDNLYHPSHFDFVPPTDDKFYYDLNWWKIREDGLAVHWDAVQVSGLVCYRELAIKFYKERIASFEADNFDRKFEPTVDAEYETWVAPLPSIDIRHGRNLTYNKWTLDHFRKKETAVNFQSSTIDSIPGWINLKAVFCSKCRKVLSASIS